MRDPARARPRRQERLRVASVRWVNLRSHEMIFSMALKCVL